MYWTAAAFILGVCGLVLLASRTRAERLRQTRADRQRSLDLIRYLRQLLELLQRHRGLCYGWMSGESALQARLWSTHQQIEDLLAEAAPFKALLHWYPSWHAMLGHWARIGALKEQPLAAEEVLLAHNQLIGELLETIRGVADKHDFVRLGGLAPQPRGFWLELLELSELIGQARALGTGIAARRQNTPAQRDELRVLRQRIADRAYLTLASLYSDPELRTPLRPNIQDAEDSLDALMMLIDQLLVTGTEASIRSVAYFHAATRTIAAHLGLVDRLLDSLQQDA